jgi:hypothetical protein
VFGKFIETLDALTNEALEADEDPNEAAAPGA